MDSSQEALICTAQWDGIQDMFAKSPFSACTPLILIPMKPFFLPLGYPNSMCTSYRYPSPMDNFEKSEVSLSTASSVLFGLSGPSENWLVTFHPPPPSLTHVRFSGYKLGCQRRDRPTRTDADGSRSDCRAGEKKLRFRRRTLGMKPWLFCSHIKYSTFYILGTPLF